MRMWHRPCVDVGRIRLVVLAAVLIAGAAGCGSSTAKTKTFQRASACRPAATAALQRAGAKDVATFTPQPEYGVTYCKYMLTAHDHPAVVLVMRDVNPQGEQRFERAYEEADQNALWSHEPSMAPQTLTRISVGADWVPGDRQLIATDGRVFLTVDVKYVAAGTGKQLAIATTRGTLGKPSKKALTAHYHGNAAATIEPVI
jgi:hypothetical protein